MTKLSRFHPVMLDADRVWGVALKTLDGVIGKSCGDKAAPEIYETVGDPGYYAAACEAALKNRMNHIAAGGEVHQHALHVLVDVNVQQHWHIYRWHKHASVIYDLDAGLAAAFMDTELRVGKDDVRMPLPTFYLAVPPELGLQNWNQSNGWHRLDGFFLSEVKMFEDLQDAGDGHIYAKPMMNIGGKMVEGDFMYDVGFERCIAVLAVGMPLEGDEIGQCALSSFALPLAIDDFEAYIDKIDSDPRYTKGMTKNVDEMRTWYRLIINTLLYLSQQPEDIDLRQERLGPSKELKRAAREGGNAARRELERATLPVRYMRLGANMVLDQGIRERSVADAETRHLTTRFMVRGHWRQQPFGEGRKQRRPAFIKPHWKGPEWAELARARVARLKDTDT